jgi:hypothetical protein
MGWSSSKSTTDCFMTKKLNWNEAFHGCPMLQSGRNKKDREREINVDLGIILSHHWLKMGVGFVIGLIEHLQNVATNNYDSLTELHTPKITVTTAHRVFSGFTSRYLVAASNGSRSASSGFLNYPRSQVPTSHNCIVLVIRISRRRPNENVSSIIACSRCRETTCPQNCSLAKAAVLSPVYTAVYLAVGLHVIILKCDPTEKDMKVWTGSVSGQSWSRIEWTRQWAVGFHKSEEFFDQLCNYQLNTMTPWGISRCCKCRDSIASDDRMTDELDLEGTDRDVIHVLLYNFLVGTDRNLRIDGAPAKIRLVPSWSCLYESVVPFDL